jgi:hypothetical protein
VVREYLQVDRLKDVDGALKNIKDNFQDADAIKYMDDEDILNGLDLYKEKERENMGKGDTKYRPTDYV